MVAFILALAVGSATWLKLKQFQRERNRFFWNWMKEWGLSGEAPTRATRRLIDKIADIQSNAGKELLPLRQSVKLVEAHHGQQRQLQRVNARLHKLHATRETLVEKIAQLQELGENHAAGWRNLEQVRAETDALQNVADQLQNS